MWVRSRIWLITFSDSSTTGSGLADPSMAPPKQSLDSLWTLSIDLWSARMLVWLASVGRNAVLTSEAHLFFFDRYRRLADCHQRRGNTTKAKQLAQKAEAHYRAGGGDEPPYAAAMALPRPKRFVTTDAVSRISLDTPDDAA